MTRLSATGAAPPSPSAERKKEEEEEEETERAWSPCVMKELQRATGGARRLYRTSVLYAAEERALLARLEPLGVHAVRIETVFNVCVRAPLSRDEAQRLAWLLGETFEQDKLSATTALAAEHMDGKPVRVLEIGPRAGASTPWCTSALAICAACGLGAKLERIERSRRYALCVNDADVSLEEVEALLHDRMTEAVYGAGGYRLTSAADDTVQPEPVKTLPLLEDGIDALRTANTAMGLAFDDWDLQYYYSLFVDTLRRNPTDVELFDIAQSNSEHSRHWFFNARLVVDGEEKDECLFDIVRDTLRKNERANDNSVIGFHDNSSAIRGSTVRSLLPGTVGSPSPMSPLPRSLDLLFTAETHNFPCAVAPFPGAETGAGGRIRDTHATGRGSIVVASTAGYCVGNLFPDELETREAYPASLAPPLQILLDASDGASDYGNKFGEPLIAGYTRTFGQRLADGSRREWLKPIMFSAGIGQIDHRHVEKGSCKPGMKIVKIGGPAYRIGLGGGAASSMASGSNSVELDFNAVQRGDAEMAHKLNRVVRACVELGDNNPIVSIHDQGAGGNCNVVKEIAYPEGARVDVRAVAVGDASLSVLEIWGAEYQENDCLLIDGADERAEHTLTAICRRERLPISIIGHITGDGKMLLIDSRAENAALQHPEEMDLEDILGELPRKTFTLNHATTEAAGAPIHFAAQDKGRFEDALRRVLKLPSVCSKRFLTSKVDRSVTGLVARQQCVGPLLLPLADYAAVASSHYTVRGGVTAIGEQPLKGLLNPAAMARLAAAEAITNMMFARVTALGDVKCSGNWMYAAKLGGEGAAMYDAAFALRSVLCQLGVAIDGGKDSLSMAADAGGETVMAPGNLVISAYVTSPDVTKGVTPALALPDNGATSGVILLVDLSGGHRRLGGSALAHAYTQLGDVSPDLTDDGIEALRAAFNVTQELLERGVIAAGHDVSDGGIAVCASEMAFAGDCGIELDLPLPGLDATAGDDLHMAQMSALFAEEVSLLIEVSAADAEQVVDAYMRAGAICAAVGRSTRDATVSLSVNGNTLVRAPTRALRSAWEETAFRLERLQCAEECVRAEEESLEHRRGHMWKVTAAPMPPVRSTTPMSSRHRVCVLREEGSNGDREMAAALELAGLEPWDVTMTDLLQGNVLLEDFRACVFVGGFSFGDVLDSAKGWAGSVLLEPGLRKQFDDFRNRDDTLSLGVCNGCQLMALLGWVGDTTTTTTATNGNARFVRNASGRFESRFVHVRIEEDNPSVLLRNMAGSVLGVWCAHGEGRALFDGGTDMTATTSIVSPMRYCDERGEATEEYPLNPNGSPGGVASLCSPDGRHTAMMPHPERSVIEWQLPYVAAGVRDDVCGNSTTGSDAEEPRHTPWLNMFHAMREWLDDVGAA